jgi:hypothetical protein
MLFLLFGVSPFVLRIHIKYEIRNTVLFYRKSSAIATIRRDSQRDLTVQVARTLSPMLTSSR